MFQKKPSGGSAWRQPFTQPCQRHSIHKSAQYFFGQPPNIERRVQIFLEIWNFWAKPKWPITFQISTGKPVNGVHTSCCLINDSLQRGCWGFAPNICVEGRCADMRWWNYQNSLYGPILQFYGFKLDDLLKVWIHYGNRECALLWVIPTTQDLPHSFAQKTFIQSKKRLKCKLEALLSGHSSSVGELVTDWQWQSGKS